MEIPQDFVDEVERLLKLRAEGTFGGNSQVGGRGPERGYSSLSRHVGRSKYWCLGALRCNRHHLIVLHVAQFFPEFQPLVERANAIIKAAQDAKKPPLTGREKRLRYLARQERLEAERIRLARLVALFPSPYPQPRGYAHA